MRVAGLPCMALRAADAQPALKNCPFPQLRAAPGAAGLGLLSGAPVPRPVQPPTLSHTHLRTRPNAAEPHHAAAVLHAAGARQRGAQRPRLDAAQVSGGAPATQHAACTPPAAAACPAARASHQHALEASPRHTYACTCTEAHTHTHTSHTYTPPHTRTCFPCSNLEPNVYSYTALLALPRHISESAAPRLLEQASRVGRRGRRQGRAGRLTRAAGGATHQPGRQHRPAAQAGSTS